MKNLIRGSFVILFSFAISIAFGQTIRSVDEFSKVSVSTNVKVKLIKADVQKIEFKLTGGEEDDLITDVKNNKLIVKIKKGNWGYSSKTQASVTVYYTTLDKIEASAGASIKSEELIKSAEMTVDVSSGAIADLEIETASLDAEVSSGGRMILEGSANGGDFEASSGANLDASRMICENVNADASSGARVKVHVNKKLNADASSGGSIKYKGNVEYTNTDSGWSGQIKRMN